MQLQRSDVRLVSAAANDDKNPNNRKHKASTMATATARTNKHKKATGGDVVKPEGASKSSSPIKPANDTPTKSTAELVAEHLPPLSLIFVVLLCSGSLFVLGLRDALATGKIIGGPMDEAMQVSQC